MNTNTRAYSTMDKKPTVTFPSVTSDGNLKVISTPAGALILSNRPWHPPVLGVPNVSWVVKIKDSPISVTYHGRVVLRNDEFQRDGRGPVDNYMWGSVGRGTIDPNYYMDKVNNYVLELFKGNWVDGYDVDLRDTVESVESNNISASGLFNFGATDKLPRPFDLRDALTTTALRGSVDRDGVIRLDTTLDFINDEMANMLTATVAPHILGECVLKCPDISNIYAGRMTVEIK